MFALDVTDRVARLTLDHPPANAIGPAWCEALERQLDGLEARDDWAVLHLRSALRMFCAGMDLAHAAAVLSTPDGPERLRDESRRVQAVLARLAALDRPTVAEIGGLALGGGLELALACDLRVAALDARLGLPEVSLGVVPAFGGTQRLSRVCGPAAAARLVLGAEIVAGEAARDLGLVQWAVPAEELPTTAAGLARRLSGFSRPALAWAKRCLAAAGDPRQDGFAMELEAGVDLGRRDEVRQAIAAFAVPRRP